MTASVLNITTDGIKISFPPKCKGASLGTHNLPAHQETFYRLVYSAKTQFTAAN